PPADGVTEASRRVCGGAKVPASARQRDIDSGIPEPDDVGRPVPVHVRKLARILILAAPTSGGRTEGSKLVCGGGKGPRCGGQRDIDSGIPEPDDVGRPVPVLVRKLARIGVVAAPTSGGRT